MTTGRHDRISLYFLLMNSIGRMSGILKRGWTSWPGNCSRSRRWRDGHSYPDKVCPAPRAKKEA